MSSTLLHPGLPSAPTSSPSPTFTGLIYLSPCGTFTPPDSSPSSPATPTATLAQVTFTPGARTFWHTHHGGQHMTVTQGKGWVCDRGGVPQRIRAGDVVYCAPGVTHWHGGDGECLMSHTVLTVGRTEWAEEVTQEEYEAAKE